MKFGFITHPIKTKDGRETVDLTLMNQFELSKSDPKVVLRWSRDNGADWSDPVLLGGDTPLANVEADARMRKAVTSAITEDDNLNDPDALLVRWVREGQAFQVVYDPRFKKHVDVTNLKGEGKEQWAPDFDGADVSVLAKSEEEAQSAVKHALLKAATDDADAHMDVFAGWMKAKMPVKKISEGKLPTIHPDTVYCKRGHQRAALEKIKVEKPEKKEKAAK